MATNDFLPFGSAVGANVMPQADYLALAARLSGFVSGTANSAQLNKAWRQSSLIAAAVAQVIVDMTGQDAIDDGTTASLIANFKSAISVLARNDTSAYVTGGGTANVQTATYSPAPAALVDGMVLRYKASVANTGACTFNPNGLGAKTIVGGSHSALQGGEIVSGGEIWLQYNTSIGAGSWVLISCSGGAVQVAPASQALHALQVGQAGHGQCRLGITSATSINLSPFDGNNIIVAGVPRRIPSGGVSLSNSGMNNNTLYYIYAYWTGSAIALEFSVSGHSTNTDGVEIKVGDATRTLVGMVYTNASAQFSDGPIARFVASWFNRRSVGASITSSGTLTFTSTSNTEISSGVRIGFLNWAGEAVDVKLSGQYTNSAATQSVTVQLYVDGSTYGNLCGSYIPSAGVGMAYVSSNSLKPDGSYLAEGFHTAQVYGAVTGNTGSILQMSHSLITRI